MFIESYFKQSGTPIHISYLRIFMYLQLHIVVIYSDSVSKFCFRLVNFATVSLELPACIEYKSNNIYLFIGVPLLLHIE